MSAETLKYQRELVEGAIEVLRDELMRAGEPTDVTNFIDAIGRLEGARDMALATTEEERNKIMNKWL